MDKPTISLEDMFSEDIKDPKFMDLYRRQKPYSNLIADIVNRRNELEMTQKELAKRARTYQSRISKIESGEHDLRLSTIINVAAALDSEVEIRLRPISAPGEQYFFRLEPSEIVLNMVRTGFMVPDQEETLGTDTFCTEELFDTPLARCLDLVYEEV